MQNFMKSDFVIEKIVLSCKVSAGTGNSIHHNRPSHGLALFVGGERTFYFDNKKIKVQKNTRGENDLILFCLPFAELRRVRKTRNISLFEEILRFDSAFR